MARRSPARHLLLAALLLVLLPGAARAQYFFDGYFGQNKVQYTTFDFEVIQTDHFDVHFYASERQAALAAARMAERAYARLSRVIGHRFTERKIIILYASPTDFGQTNTTDVGEGTQGVTDFFRQRNVLFLQGAGAETDHVLAHEMVHQFQFDVFSRGRAGANVQLFAAVAPPLWFMEGMAEYLSIGPVTPETAMWLRDAVYENRLPTIEQMTSDYRIFPYRFGHALWSYIGERWGDEAVGAILKGSTTGGIEAAIRRTLGLSLSQLSDQWRDHVIRTYLPEVGERTAASLVAQVALDQRRSGGRLHIAPALSPDGSLIAFFSERDGWSVDMYLASTATGEVERRLLKPTWSSNYETFRFLNSQAAWSPDGRYLAVSGRRGKYDDIVILEPRKNKTVRRLPVKLDGMTTPTWSPDGRRLVFTGFRGGLSDLYVIDADGRNLRQLTNDPFADLHPTWSPDGSQVAFVTDRGPDTDLSQLRFGNYRIAVYDLATETQRVLDHMDVGKNINPQWAPDGRSLAFVSDRGGVSDIFLYDFADDAIYQLTTLLTGSAGFTPLSPVMSWGHQADRIAFMYYERGAYDVYVLDNPRKLKGAPYRGPDVGAPPRQVVQQAAPRRDSAAVGPEVGQGGSIYRGREGFRRADSLSRADSARPAPPPISVAQLLDSATLALPDTSEFTFAPYRKRYSPDFVARPSIGYVQDAFGNGVYGSTAIALSDVLGNTQMSFALAINGRINEGFVQASYADFSRRNSWAVGVSQIPYFFALPTTIEEDVAPGINELRSNTRRLVYRQATVSTWYPLSRFQRLEASLLGGWVDDDIVSVIEPYDVNTGFFVGEPRVETTFSSGVIIGQPTLAYVFDNTIFGYVGPYRGSRFRLSAGITVGGWNYSSLLADVRKYQQLIGPVTFASRLLYYGRLGRDADQFSIFIGIPDIIRGHTSGSYGRDECGQGGVISVDGRTCASLDRLVGEQVVVGNFELRFPLLSPQFRWVPAGFPPIEGTIFYDVGMAWSRGNNLSWSLPPTDPDPNNRAPIMAWGVGARVNLFGLMLLRADWAFPINRLRTTSLFTISLGPTF